MHLLRTAIALAAATPVLAAAPAALRWDSYANARYGYEVCYPADLMEPQPEADAGDGRTFIARDGAELRAWGQYNALDRTLAEAEAADRAAREQGGAAILYAARGARWYVLSGRRGDRVFYARTLLAGDRFVSFAIEYPAAQAARWDRVAARIARCLRAD